VSLGSFYPIIPIFLHNLNKLKTKCRFTHPVKQKERKKERKKEKKKKRKKERKASA